VSHTLTCCMRAVVLANVAPLWRLPADDEALEVCVRVRAVGADQCRTQILPPREEKPGVYALVLRHNALRETHELRCASLQVRNVCTCMRACVLTI
jgi:hypothetical protein